MPSAVPPVPAADVGSVLNGIERARGVLNGSGLNDDGGPRRAGGGGAGDEKRRNGGGK
jgi:hypothetical protein